MQRKDRQEDPGADMTLAAVGVVRSPLQEPILRADHRGITLQGVDLEQLRRHARETAETVSEIEILPGWEELVDGIEGFSHLLVITWAHLVPREGRALRKVHPMGRQELPLTGIFATCSPARPNPLLVNAVELLERRGNVLRVKGLEAVDGTPLVDIKPYVPTYYKVESPRLADWMQEIVRRFVQDGQGKSGDTMQVSLPGAPGRKPDGEGGGHC